MNNLNLDSRLSSISNSMENANEEVVDRVIHVDINKLSKNELNFYDDNYDLDNLVESIKEFGLIEPILITKDYKIISGHRRYNACVKAGIDKVKASITKDDSNLKIKLIEANRYRTKTPEERSEEVKILHDYYKKLEAEGKKPKGRIRDLISKETGVSSATVQRTLNKINSGNSNLVSDDTITEPQESIEGKEFSKLTKQLNKVINMNADDKLEVSDYVLELMYKLRDHIVIKK